MILLKFQPPALYQDLIDRELIRDTETLHEIYQRLIHAGDTAGGTCYCDRKCTLFV